MNKIYFAFSLVVISLVCFIMLALIVGGSTIGLKDVINLVLNYKSVSELVKIIIFEIRIPRIISAVVVGATLAASGTLIKCVMRNPLADTGLLGIQTGASLCAIITILIFPKFLVFLPILAFFGGLCAYFILTVLAYKDGIKPLRLVLSGVAVNAFFGSIIGLVMIFNADRIQNTLSWINGSLASVSVLDSQIILIYGVLGLIISFFTIGKCNLLALDDLTIMNLGENITLIRFVLASISVLLASISVALVGIIGFVGLIIPHIAKLIIGSNHKVLLPFSILLGATFVLAADTIQIILFSPVEVPVGIVISLVGAPFFLFLLRKQRI